ncbi:prolactin receptor isoform X2 [Esox lucius]|uniref:prolactin receptor isoform X2 n=1 Tax=Esox lucius TaxID=8010 RepID=UPI0014769F04|nr:prolactin receptor isoform X2 [Esox lucius]
MLWLLVLLLPQMGCVGSTQNFLHPDNDHIDGVAVMKKRPQIYYCRSPNMEVFTCWWHPLDNSSESDGNVTYSLTYTVEKGPKRDCPDYVTGGPNSCHFDSSHTSIWTMYCMTVDARTSHGVFSSQEHCLDVADIVETEAPVDLTYTLMNSSEEEAGRTALVTWAYPNPTHIQYGWITLVFELQFRRVAEPNNWKVKRLLRETQLELLDMPVGEYVVRVRCRSRNQGIWSKWSASLLLTIPAKSTPGKPLTRLPVTISVTGVGVVVLLLIIFGIIPQGKRIKAFLLPPIPKPHIRGIDPLLLKGSLDEINRHFISFHGYQPPSYSEEVWDSVSTDGNQPLQGLPGVLAARTEEYSLALPPSAIHGHPLVQTGPSLASFTPVPAFYCQAPVEDFSTAWAWPTTNLVQPELLAFPGTDYSMMVEPNQQATPLSSNQDFYTCVNVMGEGGEVHLVPCLSSHRKSSLQVQPDEELTDGGLEKSRQLFDYIANLTAANGRTPEETEVEKEGSEQCEVAVPLLPEITSTPGNRV